MTISRATLRQDLFKDVYDDLNANISDPLSRGKQWMFSRMPDTNAESFPGFPLVLVEISANKENATLDNNQSDVDAEIRVWVFSRQSKQTRTLPDEIDARFNDTNFPQFDFIDYDEDANHFDLNGQTIHWRRMSHFVGVSPL